MRALQRAAELLGGQEALALYLHVGPLAVKFWITGSAGVPPDVFTKVVDLLTDHSMEEIQARRES
jgi:DNA-binding transcriptional regulator YdaS (Cro superfamily)